MARFIAEIEVVDGYGDDHYQRVFNAVDAADARRQADTYVGETCDTERVMAIIRTAAPNRREI